MGPGAYRAAAVKPRGRWWAVAAAACLWLVSATIAPAQTATRPAAKPAAPKEPADAADAYDQLVAGYMHGDFDKLPDLLREANKHFGKMSVQHRKDFAYIKTAVAQQRPAWWEQTKSPTNISFNSTIWGKSVMANYLPDDTLGFDRPVAIVNGRIATVVVWRPTQVDNPRPAEGTLAEPHHFTKGDLGEVIVWHELGHNFITSNMSPMDAIRMYEQQPLLFSHLQEYFADLTALYHASAHARLMTLVARTDLLDPPYGQYSEIEPHTRGSNAVGAMMLHLFLSQPGKWPHVHFPATPPEGQTELKTMVYIYEHFDPQLSFDEDRALREYVLKFVQTKGDQTFRSRGMVPLESKLTFSLMEAQDRDLQKQRDKWVAQKLKEFAAAGLADSADTDEKPAGDKKGMKKSRIEIPMY